jgi:hypothetical protein
VREQLELFAKLCFEPLNFEPLLLLYEGSFVFDFSEFRLVSVTGRLSFHQVLYRFFFPFLHHHLFLSSCLISRMETLRIATKPKVLPTTKSALDTTDVTAIKVSCSIISSIFFLTIFPGSSWWS